MPSLFLFLFSFSITFEFDPVLDNVIVLEYPTNGNSDDEMEDNDEDTMEEQMSCRDRLGSYFICPFCLCLYILYRLSIRPIFLFYRYSQAVEAIT